MTSITFFSLKGGTGKTSLLSAIGWLLAQKGDPVLMIDLDPQGHLTQTLKVHAPEGSVTLFEALIHGRPLAETIRPTSLPRLSLIPAAETHLELSTALFHQPWREWKLKDALTAMPSPSFAWVLLDVGANINLITYNALFAARNLIIPTLPDAFSYLSLKTLFSFLDRTGRNYHYRFERIGILLNRWNNHRPLDRETRKALQRYYPRFLLPVAVREDPRVGQAAKEQTPLPEFAPGTTAVRDLQQVVRLLETAFPRP